MPLHLFSIASGDDPRPDRVALPDQLGPALNGEDAADGKLTATGDECGDGNVRHGTSPLAIIGLTDAQDGAVSHSQIRDCHNSATINSGPSTAALCAAQPKRDEAGESQAVVIPAGNDAAVTSDSAYPQSSVCGINGDLTHGAANATGGRGIVTSVTFSAGADQPVAAPTPSGAGIAGRGAGDCGSGAAAERQDAVTCEACCGSGRNAHFPWLACGVCFGAGSIEECE